MCPLPKIRFELNPTWHASSILISIKNKSQKLKLGQIVSASI